jgi:hypothetical protein
LGWDISNGNGFNFTGIKKMNHKLLKNSLITLVILFTILVSTILYLLYWPVNTLIVKNAPMPIIGSTTLKHGEYVTYRYDYCKYYDHPLSIQRDFVDGIIFRTEPGFAQLEPGCHVADVKVIIPETLPAGNYKIRNITQVVVNQLRTKTTTYETQEFTVEH